MPPNRCEECFISVTLAMEFCGQNKPNSFYESENSRRAAHCKMADWVSGIIFGKPVLPDEWRYRAMLFRPAIVGCSG